MANIEYREVTPTPVIWMIAILAGAFVAAAGLSVLYIEHHGHIVTGMNNRIVWGLPHVFAIFLIVAASGALNVASHTSNDIPPASRGALEGLAGQIGGVVARLIAEERARGGQGAPGSKGK